MFVGHVCDAPEKQASKENKMKPAALGTETTEWPNENSSRREQFVGSVWELSPGYRPQVFGLRVGAFTH